MVAIASSTWSVFISKGTSGSSGSDMASCMAASKAIKLSPFNTECIIAALSSAPLMLF
jgi:hypothetical protein